MIFTAQQKLDFSRRGFSRRHFGRLAALAGGAASLPFFNEAALAQRSQIKGMPKDAVRINSNENPLGPCPEALEAVYQLAKEGGRYLFDLTDEFQETFAAQEGVPADYVRPYAGSSAPLHQAVLAFTSPTRSYVVADPGYESGANAATFIGAKVVCVPLTKTYAHDVKAMVAAGPDAGLFYICNPNNPTGSLTPPEDIDWLVANMPKGSVLLLDEAYTHIAGAPLRSDLVKAGKDVIILRTFSKIYGMAGLRAGAAIARPELLEKLSGYSAGMMPIIGMGAALASLRSKDLVPTRRKLIGEVRKDTFAFLDKHGFKYVPSVSNCFMIDTGKPGEDTVLALRKENVYIGRVWAAWPNHVRVTVGTADEMAKFKTAFLKVMA